MVYYLKIPNINILIKPLLKGEKRGESMIG